MSAARKPSPTQEFPTEPDTLLAQVELATQLINGARASLKVSCPQWDELSPVAQVKSAHATALRRLDIPVYAAMKATGLTTDSAKLQMVEALLDAAGTLLKTVPGARVALVIPRLCELLFGGDVDVAVDEANDDAPIVAKPTLN